MALSACLLIIALTYGALSSSKIAVGSITFDFKSPTIDVNNGLKMFYSNVDEDSNILVESKLTFGDDSAIGAETITPYYVTFSSNQDGITDYYVKIIYEFEGINSAVVDSISMGTSAVAVGAKYMSVPTLVEGSAYRFESFSVAGENSQTPDKISVGETIDLFSFINSLSINFSDIFIDTCTFKATVVVDLGDSFTSSHKAQTSVSGTMGLFVKKVKGVLSDNVAGATLCINSYYGCDGGMDEYLVIRTTDSNDVYLNTVVASKWTFEVVEINTENSANCPYKNKTYKITDILDNLNNKWTVTLTTRDDTYISLLFESQEVVPIGQINLTTLINNGSVCVPSQWHTVNGDSLLTNSKKYFTLDKTLETQLKFYCDDYLCEDLTTDISVKVHVEYGNAAA